MRLIFVRGLAIGFIVGALLLALGFLVASYQLPGDQAPLSAAGAPGSPTLDSSNPGTPTPGPSTPAQPGTLYVSAERNGRSELYALALDGAWSQVSQGNDTARAPALSPDGKTLVYQSHRDGNWEVYRLDLSTGRSARLTNRMAYDGAPSWSPDGAHIAFESYASGDLDVWTMNADGSNPVNLTPDSPSYDFGPAWSPRDDLIAFTSLEAGHKQIYTVPARGGPTRDVSVNQFDEEQPTWSPDGSQLAFVSNQEGCEEVTSEVALDACQRREIFVADFDGKLIMHRRQLTFDGHASSPVWSPDGKYIAYVSPRPDRQSLFVVPVGGGTARDQTPSSLWIDSVAWSPAAYRAFAAPDELEPLYVEKPIAAPAADGHPYAMRAMKEIYLAPSWGQLSSRVANSLLQLKSRVRSESGYDFLGVLSDMARAIESKCNQSCDNLSWHKSGRAIDTRLEYYDSSGRSLLEIVREDEQGETYWRLYLRAAAQDGTQGEPLKDEPWDLSDRSRSQIGFKQGGIRKPLPYGYYVDFTELARLYGWERISSHDDPDFDWHSDRLAMEYWHYQKTDGLAWYSALAEVYGPSELTTFDWNWIARNWGVEQFRMMFKQIPPPPAAWEWYGLVPEHTP